MPLQQITNLPTVDTDTDTLAPITHDVPHPASDVAADTEEQGNGTPAIGPRATKPGKSGKRTTAAPQGEGSTQPAPIRRSSESPGAPSTAPPESITEVLGLMRDIWQQNNLLLAETRQNQATNERHFAAAQVAAINHTDHILEAQQDRHTATEQRLIALSDTLSATTTITSEQNDAPACEGVRPSQIVEGLSAAIQDGVLVRDPGHYMVTGDIAPYHRSYMKRSHNFVWRNKSAPKRALDDILSTIEDTGGDFLQQPLPRDHPARRFRRRGFRNNCVAGWRVRDGHASSQTI
ncbi:uncharacterized protein EV422DRAFT_533345 [Fimicolochytrium jonesii]|uniref:uncharacterized protein n=1 Tax=Fimicolochytrium jonesii TaxID=1396493 RepID=UPI0022FEF72F|nr:uncharacterized protein EV422DRAFT_533345 [Fimicolochytrium jonesii]KAI8820025.1 hypothetical protein EV422DRAFT_533345 [Fimicolochytrium jonesii]